MMEETRIEPSGPHDLGGRSAGPVDLTEHDTAYWEWQIDAMMRLVMQRKLLLDFAELRDGIERLGPEDYEKCSYYERWAKSLVYVLVGKGVVTEQELRVKSAQIRNRQEEQG